MMPQRRIPQHPLSPPDELARRTDINWNAKMAWTVIWACQDAAGLCQWRLRDLAERIGLPERTMRDALAELVNRELLTPIRMPGKITHWAVNWPVPKAEDRRISPKTPADFAVMSDAEDRRISPGSTAEGEESGGFSEGAPADFAGLARAPALSSFLTTYPNSYTSPGDQREGDPDRLDGAPTIQQSAPAAPLSTPLIPSGSAWKQAAKVAREGVDPEFVLEKFNARFGPGGEEQTETDCNWTRRWLAWVKKERAPSAVAAAAPGGARAPDDSGLRSIASRRMRQVAEGKV